MGAKLTFAADRPLKRLGPRVVIADESAVYREFLAYLLAIAGANVIGEAVDGEQALHVVRSLKPNLVLINVQMPCVDGLQATQRIKKYVPSARVIVLSGATGRECSEAARRSGADAFLSKKIMPTALVSAIQEVVSRTSSQEAHDTRAAS